MPLKRATITDVAKAAGISIGAVSRILNADPSITVREETRAAVHRAMAELGYSPNPHARSLRLARAGSIAMILPEIESPAFPMIIQGAQRAAHQRGYAMLLGGVGSDGDDPGLPARLLLRNRVDGFLISTGLREEEMLTALKTLEAPSVLLNRFLDDAHPHVVLDDMAGTAAILRHLLQLGHRRIGFLGSSERFLGRRRVAGYQTALQEAGIPFDPALVANCTYDRAGGEGAMNTLLSQPQPPTAVFATNHLVAAGAMAAVGRHGLSIPADLSVASFYDGPVAELLNPPLTAIRFPLEQLGFQATAMLIDLLEGRPVPQAGAILPHDGIVVRGSTAPPATAHVSLPARPAPAPRRPAPAGRLRPTRG